MPRNSLLAQVFYYGEMLEKWGTGTIRMIALCKSQGILEPEFQQCPIHSVSRLGKTSSQPRIFWHKDYRKGR